MDYQTRRRAAVRAVVEHIKQRHGEVVKGIKNTVMLEIAMQPTAFVCDCIPASMSVAAARELVGQPFLDDHGIARKLPVGVGGPVHLIACQKSVTETQAMRQLGFPEAVIVPAPFGIYVADDVQKIQMVFISNCRDATTTRHKVQRFLEWLHQESEDRLLAKRAAARRLISDLIASVQD